MRKQIYAAMKEYCRSELLNTRKRMKISQEEMAHKLLMSTRAYVALEGGKFCCSLITLIIFLQQCPIDRDSFFKRLTLFLDKSLSNAA